MAKEKQIGKITHYFNKIGVGVIELESEIKVGDTIHIVGGEERDFEQTVDSMQIEHEKVKKAGKGEAIGLKVEQSVKPGDKVYKVLE
jgi:putative protease